MPDFLWAWTEGPGKVYTSRVEDAEKALRAGFLVIGIRAPQPKPVDD